MVFDLLRRHVKRTTVHNFHPGNFPLIGDLHEVRTAEPIQRAVFARIPNGIRLVEDAGWFQVEDQVVCSLIFRCVPNYWIERKEQFETASDDVALISLLLVDDIAEIPDLIRKFDSFVTAAPNR